MSVCVRVWAAGLVASSLIVGCTVADKDKPAEIASGDEVRVVDVVKGDEVVVEKDGRRAKIRLLGVHAYDAVIEDSELQNFAAQSTSQLRAAVVGQIVTVTLGKRTKDTHGRYLGYLAQGQRDINRFLIEAGLGVVYTEYPFAREAPYMKAEQSARMGRTGVWGSDRSTKVSKGLRKQWAEYRQERGNVPVTDPLLSP